MFIVVYLNRISRQQYAGNIVARVSEETLRLVGELPYGPHTGMRVGEPAPTGLAGRSFRVPSARVIAARWTFQPAPG